MADKSMGGGKQPQKAGGFQGEKKQAGGPGATKPVETKSGDKGGKK